jgi:hypothetical protein
MSSNITVTMPNDKGEPEAKRTREACLNCRSVRLLFSRHSQMPLLTTDPDERKHVAPVGVRRANIAFALVRFANMQAIP